MIEINKQGRGTRKTTKVIALMEQDEDLYCIIPYESWRTIYPSHLWNRIISVNSLRGRRLSKVVLDEGFHYEKDKLAEIYYYLGYHHIDVVVYGTI